MIATIGHEDYIKSQIIPYFGLTANPDNRKVNDPSKDALKVLFAQNFIYNIYRYYHADDNIHHTNITIAVRGQPTTITEAQLISIMSIMNFNFAEWSYLDLELYRRVYADAVHTLINNREVDWTKLENLYE